VRRVVPSMTVEASGAPRTRRRLLQIAVLLCAFALVATPAVRWRLAHRHLPLYALGVAVRSDGTVSDIQPGDRLVPGSRVIDDGPSSGALAREQLQWLDRGTVPELPELPESDMMRSALLDLRVLSGASGPTVAGWTPSWRYVWPRDSAFVASAFARTGHLPEADRLLTFLASVQQPDGRFRPRYDTAGHVPDDRGVQLDGTGWALWALDQVAAQIPAHQRAGFMLRHRPLLDRSANAVLAMIDSRTGLPPVSVDYWEVPETELTLATCAVLLAGLRSAVSAYQTLGETERAAAVGQAAERLERATIDTFGGGGYPRRAGGRASTVDLGLAFLLPPFAGTTQSSAISAWRRAPEHLDRPAGGLAPGGSWRRDGVSWTPTTATWSVAAACVDPEQAIHWLRWLDAHRTAVGSIPEKVLADGSPAAVAPLAWSSAAVLIAADQLDRGCTGYS